jgi:signal recognition particle receptor subunit beta
MLNPQTRGKLLSLSTEADRTLFFDFLPVDLGKLNDFSIRFQLYTVPGQVRYNATRKLVLRGADAVVFVADSQREMREQNIESLKNMRENLLSNNIKPEEIPVIFQYNKRDLPNILSVDELNKDLNDDRRYEFVESVAIDGKGVEDTFRKITKLVLQGISKKHQVKIEEQKEIIEANYEIESTSYQEATTIDKQREYEDSNKTEREITLKIEENSYKKDTVVKKAESVFNEKLDTIIDSINVNNQLIKELKDIFSRFTSELNDIKKNQKGIDRVLNGIKDDIESLKVKKKWFKIF